jgi:hypothetical protein
MNRSESWHLIDHATGRALGSKAYPTLAEAARKRAELVKLAATISRECGQEAKARCDVRKGDA